MVFLNSDLLKESVIIYLNLGFDVILGKICRSIFNMEQFRLVISEINIDENLIIISLFIGNEILEGKILFVLLDEGKYDWLILEICV